MKLSVYVQQSKSRSQRYCWDQLCAKLSSQSCRPQSILCPTLVGWDVYLSPNAAWLLLQPVISSEVLTVSCWEKLLFHLFLTFSFLSLAQRQRNTMVSGQSYPYSSSTFLSFWSFWHTQMKFTLRPYPLFICFNWSILTWNTCTLLVEAGFTACLGLCVHSY